MSRRAVEGVKTALIVLLVITALILAYFSNLFLAPERPAPRAERQESGLRSGPGDAARPMCIAVTLPDGSRLAEQYDGAALGAAFEKTVNLLSEALGSAGAPAETDEARWREALASPGLYYEYFAPVPMAVLCSWLGTEAGSTAFADVSALCLTGGRLCFRDGAGTCYACDTAVPEGATASLSDLCTHPAVFAFEDPVLEGFGCGSQLIFAGEELHSPVTAETPLTGQEARYALLEALDAAMFEKSGYMEGDGTYVYVATDFTLRMGPDGTVIYRRSGELDRRPASLTDDICRAELMCARLLSPFAGDADVCYTGVETEDGATRVFFDYNIAGGLISLSGGSAAEIRLEGGTITEMRLRLLRFALTGEGETLLPERQAAAAAAGPFRLVYVPAGGLYAPRWMQRPSIGGTEG